MFKGTLTPPGLVSSTWAHDSWSTFAFASEGQSFTWKKFTPNNAHVAGFNRYMETKVAPNRLHHFLGEGSTDYQGFKVKQTTKEGKY